jgi:monoterpene epsilon-lactone hydrolase
VRITLQSVDEATAGAGITALNAETDHCRNGPEGRAQFSPWPIRQGNRKMADPEIAALRALIASRPRVMDIEQRRRDINVRGRQFPMPSGVIVESVSAGGVAAEWTLTRDAAGDRAILYLHGGGYVIGSLDSHRHLVAEICRAATTRTLAIDYRLAPEHPFPAAVEDTVAAYRYLLDSGIRPSKIALAGDSAGGGLVVGAMLAIRAAGLTLPGCGWCISPWFDMEALGGSFIDRSAADPTVQKAGILDMARLYLGDTDPRTPFAAPLYGDLHGLPPLLIQVGASETLLDDSICFTRAAGAADTMVELQIWPEMIHVWHLYYPILGVGRRAIAKGGGFVLEKLGEE